MDLSQNIPPSKKFVAFKIIKQHLNKKKIL